jgi:DNA polymerase V
MKQITPKHGGLRPGAGRKSGTGTYGEPTIPLRIPEGAVASVHDFLAMYQLRKTRKPSGLDILVPADNPRKVARPLFGHKVPAGFPSPADDYVEARLDLNDYLVEHKEATFFVRVKGNSMTGAGIFDGDILVVDRSLEPAANHIVIAVIDNELTVKRLTYRNGHPVLKAENPRYNDIELKDGQELQVWGIVTSTVRKLV